MSLWKLLLLLSDLVVCASVPAPLNVSIWSFNMEHILHFLPGPGTPANARFTVEILRYRRSMWKPVSRCSDLLLGQDCNLTRVFKDPLDVYQARVLAFIPRQKSNWTETRRFHPLSDTVLGPPLVSLSGCGNCLLLRVSPPTLKTDQHLDLFSDLRVHVQRSRDGAEFSLTLLLSQEHRIEYLQRGVEYCVTVALHTLYNSNATPSKRHCSLTSPPQPNPVYLVHGLLAAFSAFFFVLLGILFCCCLVGKRTLQQCFIQRSCLCSGCARHSPGL